VPRSALDTDWLTDCHLASRRATSATSPTQLCSGLAGCSWQAVLTFSWDGGMWGAHSGTGIDCIARRLALVVASDFPNESSVFEMYKAVRCHIPEDPSLRAAEFVVQPIDFGLGTCWMGTELCWLVLGSAQICCCSVVLSCWSCTVVVLLLYPCTVVLL
jgi:hypothetical protein